MITIYGASDDLIEVYGCENPYEFYAYNERWQGDLAAPGEGERMRVHCWADRDGCWQVGVGQVAEDVPLPPWRLAIRQGAGMTKDALAGKARYEPAYSAVLEIDAPEGTRLVNVIPKPGEAAS